MTDFKIINPNKTAPVSLMAAALLLLLSVPCVSSLQLLVNLSIIIILGYHLYKNEDFELKAISKNQNKLFINNKLALALLCIVAYYFCMILGHYLNDFRETNLSLHLVDYIIFISVPVLFALSSGSNVISNFNTKKKVFLTIICLQFLVLINTLFPNQLISDIVEALGLQLETLPIGICLMVISPLAVIQLIENPRNVFWVSVFLLVSCIIALTNISFSLFLLFPVIFLNLLVLLKGKRKWIGLGLVGTFFIPIFLWQSNQDGQKIAHFEKHELSDLFFVENNNSKQLLFGKGPSKSKVNQALHFSQYNRVIQESGLIGLFFFVGFFGFLLSNIATEIYSPQVRLILFQSVGIFLVLGFFYDLFHSPATRQVLMIIVTWIMAKTTLEAEISDDSGAIQA